MNTARFILVFLLVSVSALGYTDLNDNKIEDELEVQFLENVSDANYFKTEAIRQEVIVEGQVDATKYDVVDSLVEYNYSLVSASFIDLAKLASEPTVDKVMMNYDYSINLASSLSAMNIPQFKNISGRTGAGVRIAVLDTGVFAAHPDLVGKAITFKDFVNSNTEPYDDNGHGTHVIGTILAIAPDAEIIALKVCNEYGSCPEYSILQALQYAKTQNISLLSMSLGRFDLYCSNPVTVAIDSLTGVIPVVSAGNSGNTYYSIGSPACMDRTIAIGAVDDSNNLATFSSVGPTFTNLKKPDFVASGVNIDAPSKNGGYISMSGTSMAAPHITGLIALMLQGSDLSQAEVEGILKKVASGADAPNIRTGWGRPILDIGVLQQYLAKELELSLFDLEMSYTQKRDFSFNLTTTRLDLPVLVFLNDVQIDSFTPGSNSLSKIYTAGLGNNLLKVCQGACVTQDFYVGYPLVSGSQMQISYYDSDTLIMEQHNTELNGYNLILFDIDNDLDFDKSVYCGYGQILCDLPLNLTANTFVRAVSNPYYLNNGAVKYGYYADAVLSDIPGFNKSILKIEPATIYARYMKNSSQEFYFDVLLETESDLYGYQTMFNYRNDTIEITNITRGNFSSHSLPNQLFKESCTTYGVGYTYCDRALADSLISDISGMTGRVSLYRVYFRPRVSYTSGTDLTITRAILMTKTEPLPYISSSKLRIVIQRLGDINNDNIVNIQDLVYVSRRYGQMTPDPLFDPNADFNSDGIINLDDVLKVVANFDWW